MKRKADQISTSDFSGLSADQPVACYLEDGFVEQQHCWMDRGTEAGLEELQGFKSRGRRATRSLPSGQQQSGVEALVRASRHRRHLGRRPYRRRFAQRRRDRHHFTALKRRWCPPSILRRWAYQRVRWPVAVSSLRRRHAVDDAAIFPRVQPRSTGRLCRATQAFFRARMGLVDGNATTRVSARILELARSLAGAPCSIDVRP